MEINDKIRLLVEEGKTEDALEIISEYNSFYKNPYLYISNSLLVARYSRLKKDNDLKLVSKDDYEVRLNEINSYILNNSLHINASQNNSTKILLPIAGIILILINIVLITSISLTGYRIEGPIGESKIGVFQLFKFEDTEAEILIQFNAIGQGLRLTDLMKIKKMPQDKNFSNNVKTYGLSPASLPLKQKLGARLSDPGVYNITIPLDKKLNDSTMQKIRDGFTIEVIEGEDYPSVMEYKDMQRLLLPTNKKINISISLVLVVILIALIFISLMKNKPFVI